ncbi:MAG: hypothetical protein Q9205_002672 [Flavoplaca limonia]
MASGYEKIAVGDLLQPPSHLNQINEQSNLLVNMDFFPHASQAEPNSVVPSGSAESTIHQHQLPPRRKPPAKRKAATSSSSSSSSERRITRTKKSKKSSGPVVFKPSPLGRAHLMASDPRVQSIPSQGGAANTEQETQEAARSSLIRNGDLATPNSGIIRTQAERSSTPTVRRPSIFSNGIAATAISGEEGRHHQEPTITEPAANKVSWFPLNAAPILPLPRQHALQFSSHPLSPLNRLLFHNLPPQITSMYPVPKGLEGPATESAERPKSEWMDIENPIRLIVTYRRLGFSFDEIATKLELAGLPPDVVTPITVECLWRKADNKEFPPWYGDGDQKLRVFEMDDPEYL